MADEKIYVLGYRDLVLGGSYLTNLVPLMACIGANLDEAVQKLEVMNRYPPCLMLCTQTSQQCRAVKLPWAQPSWFTGTGKAWHDLLDPRVIWEIRQMEKTFSGVHQAPMLYEIKKIKRVK